MPKSPTGSGAKSDNVLILMNHSIRCIHPALRQWLFQMHFMPPSKEKSGMVHPPDRCVKTCPITKASMSGRESDVSRHPHYRCTQTPMFMHGRQSPPIANLCGHQQWVCSYHRCWVRHGDTWKWGGRGGTEGPMAQCMILVLLMLKMRPSVVATHYKCCSSCLTLLHTQCTL